jgi:hypothetical protein
MDQNIVLAIFHDDWVLSTIPTHQFHNWDHFDSDQNVTLSVVDAFEFDDELFLDKHSYISSNVSNNHWVYLIEMKLVYDQEGV